VGVKISPRTALLLSKIGKGNQSFVLRKTNFVLHKKQNKQSHLKAVKRQQNVVKKSPKAVKKAAKKVVKKNCQKSYQKSCQKAAKKVIKKAVKNHKKRTVSKYLLGIIYFFILPQTFSGFSYFWTLSYIFQAFITLNKI
jgi:hypothetical protein